MFHNFRKQNNFSVTQLDFVCSQYLIHNKVCVCENCRGIGGVRVGIFGRRVSRGLSSGGMRLLSGGSLFPTGGNVKSSY